MIYDKKKYWGRSIDKARFEEKNTAKPVLSDHMKEIKGVLFQTGGRTKQAGWK